MSPCPLVRVGLLAVIVTACHRPPSDTAGPSSGTAAVAVASAAAPHVPNGCDLIARPDLEAIVATPLAPPRLHEGLCEYPRAAGPDARLDLPVVSLRLYRSITKAAFEEETIRGATLVGAPRRAVAALGEEAFQSGEYALAVYAGGAAVAVLSGDPAVDATKAKAIAARALLRLPEVAAR